MIGQLRTISPNRSDSSSSFLNIHRVSKHFSLSQSSEAGDLRRIQPTLSEHRNCRHSFDARIDQPGRGYRFTSDAVALAEFVRIASDETLLDLCSGPAVVPLLLWQHSPFLRSVCVELDELLAAQGRINVIENALSSRIQVIQGDVRELPEQLLTHPAFLPPGGKFDVITANPPYWPVRSGRLNPNPQKEMARHEIALKLEELVQKCSRLLTPGGRLYLCHLRSRELELRQALERQHFYISRLELIQGRNARVLVEAQLIQPSEHRGRSRRVTLQPQNAAGIRATSKET